MSSDSCSIYKTFLSVHRFFSPLCTRESAARKQCLDNIAKTVQKAVITPKESSANNKCSIKHLQLSYQNNVVAIMDVLPFLLMLSIQCPFKDVREQCSKILELLKEVGIPVPLSRTQGPSSFISSQEVVIPGTEDQETQMIFIDAFLQNNRLDHITQLIGFHPDYLNHFLKTQHFILKGDGPLPYDYRHYIAIMAAARHQCTYLVHLQKQEFLLQGGNELWLQGLDHIPQKLQDLTEINKILAHKPWLIGKSHIEKLTKGKDNWSLSEVVHAVVLLAHFHSLCSFVFGSGIYAELDHEEGHTYNPNAACANGYERSERTPLQVADDTEGVEELMEKMKSILEQRIEEPTDEELVKTFEKVENQSAELVTRQERASNIKSDVLRFNDDPSFSYQDFARRGEHTEISTFRIQDYSWDDHAYSLLNRLYSDVGTLLDEKFKLAYDLTYYTMGHKNNVDTSMFRRAVWNYIHCMFGIRHDDYDYKEVNELLERNLKTYIKTVCCFPDRVTKRDYENVMRAFRHSEKVHVNLMLFEARMQAELLYALRAIMQYMT